MSVRQIILPRILKMKCSGALAAMKKMKEGQLSRFAARYKRM